jgi:hypothetical protein
MYACVLYALGQEVRRCRVFVAAAAAVWKAAACMSSRRACLCVCLCWPDHDHKMLSCCSQRCALAWGDQDLAGRILVGKLAYIMCGACASAVLLAAACIVVLMWCRVQRPALHHSTAGSVLPLLCMPLQAVCVQASCAAVQCVFTQQLA